MIIVRSMVAAAFGLAASCVFAEVEIVDRPVGDSTARDQSSSSLRQTTQSQPQYDAQSVVTTTVEASGSSLASASPSQQGASAPGNIAAEMYYQMQVMQQEIQELRGLVEEQAFQIKKLKQQRLDDYVDLDRRISSLNGSGAAATSPTSSANVGSRPVTGSSITGDEKSHYQQAVDPIVGTTKNLDLAISRLHEHLERFPKGRYEGNAQYWLGESYLVKDDLQASKKWFESLLNDYPLHNKVLPAKYKLGVVYHKLGLNAQAKVLLGEVSGASGPAASRASEYLNANF